MIRVRLPQRKNDEGQWYDDAYILENKEHELTFHYNLTWERTGANINHQLQQNNVLITLENIEGLIAPNQGLRWLEIEHIPDHLTETFLEELDERCAIPNPRSIADRLNQTLVA